MSAFKKTVDNIPAIRLLYPWLALGAYPDKEHARTIATWGVEGL